MKKFVSSITILLGLVISSSIFGQDIKVPNWIKGTWHNSYESNTHNFEYWTFSNDSIYVKNGILNNKSNRTCLNKKYSDYKIKTEINDSLLSINFIKDKESVIYEFRLCRVNYSDKPILTYSIEINGEIKKQHSTSCNLVLTK